MTTMSKGKEGVVDFHLDNGQLEMVDEAIELPPDPKVKIFGRPPAR